MSKAENKVKKVVAILMWSLLALVAAANFMWYFVPPEEFFEYMKDPMEHTVLLGFLLGLAGFLIVDVVFLKEDFCVYICPYSRVQSVLYDDDTIMAVYDPKRGGEIYQGHGYDRKKIYTKQKDLLAVEPGAECTTCESCVTVCPTHIDIRKGLQLECINCLECVDACTEVMAAFNKPSLVRWSSEKEAVKYEGKTNYFRGKVIAYFVVLAIVLVSLFMMGSTKEHMLLNINKSTRLYKTLPNGVVQNDYLFLFQNTDSKPHTYTFEIINNDKIEIVRPKNPIKIGPGFKAKEVVILEAKEPLAQSQDKDVSIPVKIKAYAIDEKEKIVIERDLIFTYPRLEALQK
jgi:cytochrome c oxidase accessory protein FixG